VGFDRLARMLNGKERYLEYIQEDIASSSGNRSRSLKLGRCASGVLISRLSCSDLLLVG
jgi:hypothetical protein